MQEIEVEEGTRTFVNLDSMWYGISSRDGWEEIHIVDDMNDYDVNPNPFGKDVDPFQKPAALGSTSYGSFNSFVQSKGSPINCIVENRFYRNVMDGNDRSLGKTLANCRYLTCLDHGLYGLEVKKEGTDFQGLEIHDIGSLIPNLD